MAEVRSTVGPNYTDGTLTEEPESAISESARNVLPVFGSTNETARDSGWEPNLLTFDGGGVRGYWSLLAMKELMEHIKNREEGYVLDGVSDPAYHSFDPEVYPTAVTQLDRTEAERMPVQAVDRSDKNPEIRNLVSAKRYLPCHYFDFIGGSSTGALIAIMLGRLRMTVIDCLEEYRTLGGRVFGHPRKIHEVSLPILSTRTKYDAKKLHRVFEEVVDRRREYAEPLSQAKFESKRHTCQTFVTTLATQSQSEHATKPYILRSYHYSEREPFPRIPRPLMRRATYRSQQDQTSASRTEPRMRRDINQGQASSLAIPEVARAATAALTYFEPLEVRQGNGTWIRFEDGGFGTTNNPTVVGLEEISGLYGRHSIGAVVSIGTARSERAESGEEKIARRIREKIKRYVKLATSPDVEHQRMQTHAAEDDIAYHRLNPSAAQHLLDIELDEWLPRKAKKHRLFFGERLALESGQKTISQIEIQFERYMSNIANQQAMQDCAEELVERRRRRTMNAARWERYATGCTFRCQQARENDKCSRDFNFRNEFERHLRKHHGIEGEEAKRAAKRSMTFFRYQEPQRLSNDRR